MKKFFLALALAPLMSHTACGTDKRSVGGAPTGRPSEVSKAQIRPKTGFAAFSPEIDVFLKEHLFADIFERDILSYQDREIITISALISLGGVEPQLQSHMKKLSSNRFFPSLSPVSEKRKPTPEGVCCPRSPLPKENKECEEWFSRPA